MEMGREALLAKMRAGRDALLAAASAAPPSARDESGWDHADHLAHVLAWEGALVAVLTGGSTPEALGYSREEYKRLDTDTLNAAIRERIAQPPMFLPIGSARPEPGSRPRLRPCRTPRSRRGSRLCGSGRRPTSRNGPRGIGC